MENMLLAAEQGNRNKAWRALLDRPRLRKLEEADRVRARQWLERFELLSQRDDLAGELSGGQKRLLEFARIAMRRPLLVLLDEPTAGVNPVLRGKIESAILGLQETGIAALLIEHDLGFVERACTLIYVMDQGSAIAHGTLEELRHVPAVVDAYLGSAEAVVGG
jgi:branched-chain amino acid transport system ATP-binding protein